jgi:hypothetical protein
LVESRVTAFVDFQTNWRDRCPALVALLLGYTNGYQGYFPTISTASRGGYGAASVCTWVEPGAGERIIDWAAVKMYERPGQLADLPDDLKRYIYWWRMAAPLGVHCFPRLSPSVTNLVL